MKTLSDDVIPPALFILLPAGSLYVEQTAMESLRNHLKSELTQLWLCLTMYKPLIISTASLAFETFSPIPTSREIQWNPDINGSPVLDVLQSAFHAAGVLEEWSHWLTLETLTGKGTPKFKQGSKKARLSSTPHYRVTMGIVTSLSLFTTKKLTLVKCFFPLQISQEVQEIHFRVRPGIKDILSQESVAG